VGAAVAAVLRQSIVSGDFADSQLLPKEDELLATFHVSRQSIREAMRILETEGLVTVRRGNVGGAVVHAPRPDTAAYMLGLVLESQGTTFADLATTLESLEPTCAARCAERADRAAAVVPVLQRHNGALASLLDEQQKFTNVARQFHRDIVALCGSDTLALIIGTLEMLWSAQAEQWAQQVSSESRYPSGEHRGMVLKAHVRITELITDGDAERARRALMRHVTASHKYVLASMQDRIISSAALRPDIRA
jgi:GntR family transcriptional regulator, transcriptional repressor for pyruvate dehydrogenase complex